MDTNAELMNAETADPELHALAAADPAKSLSLESRLARTLLSETLDHVAPRPRRRTMAIVVSGLVAALAIGAATPAVASRIEYLAQTGWFGSPNPGATEGTEGYGTEADTSEWLDITAPDFVEFAVTLYPDYAFLPEGYDQIEFATAIAQMEVDANTEQNEGRSALLQTTGIVSIFENHARCMWRRAWLDADAAGDIAKAAAAATVLVEGATWPATVETDGGGIVDAEKAVAQASFEGDRTFIEHAMITDCPLPPEGFGE